MSWEALKWAYGVELPPTAKLILVTLAYHADDEGKCYPGVARIAKMTGANERTVKRQIGQLEAAGHVTTQRRIGCGNKYRLNLSGPVTESHQCQCVTSDRESPHQCQCVTTTSDTESPEYSFESTKNIQGAAPSFCFDDFWRVWPKKEGEEEARRVWKKLRPSGDLAAVIIEDVIARAQADQKWLKDEGAFIPSPSNYLTGKRWKDEWRPAKAVHHSRLKDVTND